MKLDHYDKTLLYELDKDATASLAYLSKKLRRSKPFTLHRIKRLEEQKVITGYHALVDMSKLGYFTFRIYLDLMQSTEQDELKIIEEAKHHKEIWTITDMHGGWDLALFIYVKHVAEFHQVWDEIKMKFKNKIKRYKVALYSPIYNFNKHFFLDKPVINEERVYGAGEIEEIDKLDWKILQVHAPACRQSSIEIAKKVKVSADTIRARIKKLRKKKIIAGYKLGMDIGKLGYESYMVDFELNDTKHIDQLFRFCKMHKSIYQINKTVGGADFEIEVIVRNAAELTKLIDEIKIKFKEMIRDDEHYLFSSFYIVNYVPD